MTRNQENSKLQRFPPRDTLTDFGYKLLNTRVQMVDKWNKEKSP